MPTATRKKRSSRAAAAPVTTAAPAGARGNRRKRPPAALAGGVPAPLDEQVQDALSSLERMSTSRDRDNLARFGITANQAFGVSIANIQVLARRLGRSHALAAALWKTGWYEARLLTAYVEEPARVTPAQMDRWCRDFDNWGICDTMCFVLFDRTPHAWARVAQWSGNRGEFVKRAAFALLASLALHDTRGADGPLSRACASSSAPPTTSGTSSRRA